MHDEYDGFAPPPISSLMGMVEARQLRGLVVADENDGF